MAFAAAFEDSVEFAGFISPEDNFDFDRKFPLGTFYGDSVLHPFLERLRKRGDKVMKRFMGQEAKSSVVIEVVDQGCEVADNTSVSSSEDKAKP